VSSKDEFSTEHQPKVDESNDSIEAILFGGMTEEQFVEYLLSANEDHLSSENQPKVDVGADVESIGSEELLEEPEESVSFSYFHSFTYLQFSPVKLFRFLFIQPLNY